MRRSLTGLGLFLIWSFGMAGVASLFLPRWPLVVAYSDLYAGFSGSVSFEAAIFLVNFLGFALIFLLALAFKRLAPRRLPMHLQVGLRFAAALVIIWGLFWVYPKVRSLAKTAGFARSGQELKAVVYVDRGMDDEPWVTALVATPREEGVLVDLPADWPFNFVEPENSLIITIPAAKLDEIVSGLLEDGFFELPEELDPRPTLHHEASYIAIAGDKRLDRIFARPFNNGFERLEVVAQGLLRRLGLDEDWWRKAEPGKRPAEEQSGSPLG